MSNEDQTPETSGIEKALDRLEKANARLEKALNNLAKTIAVGARNGQRVRGR